MPIMLPSRQSSDPNGMLGRTILPTRPSGGDNPALTREQFDAMSMRVYNRVNETDQGVSPWEHVGRWAAGTAIDTADTLWSTPLNPMGERGDIWQMASAEQKEYYERHKGLIEGSSAVVGGIGMAVAAEALVIPRLTGALASSTAIAGSSLWRAGRAWNVMSQRNMLLAQRAAAESGEAFGLFSSPAGRAFVRNRMAAGVGTFTRTMPVEYAMMWNNEAFNTGEWDREGFAIGAVAALGGAVGGIAARSTVRRVANSAEIRDKRWAAMVMAGVSNDLMSSDHLRIADRIAASDVQLKESARLTEFLVGARAASSKGMDEAPEYAARQSQMRNAYKNLATDSTQTVISKGISGVDTYKDSVVNMPEAENIVNHWGKQDPFLFHGMAEGGLLKGTVAEARTTRKAYIESLKKQSDAAAKKGLIKEAERLNRLTRLTASQEEHVLVNGSWMNPDSDLAKAAFDHRANKVDVEGWGDDGVKMTLPKRGQIRLDASLTPLNGNGSKIMVESLSLRDRMHLDEAATQLVKKLTRKDAKTKFRLTDEAAGSWYSLDLAAEILDKGGSIDFALKKLNGKLNNADDLRRLSLRLKARSALSEAGMIGRISDELRYRYNLPASTALEKLEDSAGDGFRKWLHVAAKEDGTARELAQGLTDMRTIQGIDLLPPTDAPLARLDGDMLRFNRNTDGKWMRPLMGYFDPKNQIELISQRGHSMAMTLRKAEKVAKLMAGKTHVNDLAKALRDMPELEQAMKVAGLHNDQMTGLGGGIRQLMGELLPKRFRARDNATILAATKLQEMAERHGLSTFRQMMDSVSMGDIVTRVTSAGNAATRTQLDQYFSLRSGWDIDGVEMLSREQGQDDLWGFLLKDTEQNRKRLGMSAEDEWDDMTFMPNERLGQPIAVNKLAMETIDAFNGLTGLMREADNALRGAKGLRDIEDRPFYTPPPNTRNALVGFVFDPAEKLVPGRTIVARSRDEYKALYRKTLDDLGNGYIIKDREQLESLRDIWDEAGMDWIDPGISAATGGIGNQKGGLVGAYVKQGAFNEALDWVKRKAIVQSQDTLRTMMDESLTVARAMGATESVVSGQKGLRNIWQEYEHALTGSSKGFSETSVGDKALREVEKRIDSLMANSQLTYPARYLVDLAQRIGMDPTDLTGAKTFEQVHKAMGKYTPFATAVEFAESRGVKRPPTVKGMAQTMNTMAASVLLRWFELPHAMMNGLGLIATMPAAVMAGKAPISTFTNVKGQSIGFIDGAKIISDAMKDMFTTRGAHDFRIMVKNGDASQSVMEYHTALGSIQSQAGFMKYMKTADKWAGILSDKSENWSRQTAHFVGLKLADYHGIAGDAARHDFAREIANSIIADYAPINRPELFQSGFGSMFGLFQSYALNHYTKMFRWMENGQYGKVGLQASMQATMFGLQGTYGLGHLMDLRDSTLATGSEPTAVDLIYEHFGPVLGGAIVHGGVSQVTQLAMWTRGDTNFRVPGMSGSLAPLDIGTKVARGFVDGVSAFLNAQSMGEVPAGLMEVIQREMPNRVLRSWLVLGNQLMQHGTAFNAKEIDAYGQVMTETQSWMDIVARVVGVRSARQQSELDAYYAGKGAMERDANKMEALRESFRTAVRHHAGDVTQVSPQQYFNDYVKAGGNPRMFKTWVRNLLRDADSPRAVKSLKNSMETTRSALETWRFGAYGAWAVE